MLINSTSYSLTFDFTILLGNLRQIHGSQLLLVFSVNCVDWPHSKIAQIQP